MLERPARTWGEQTPWWALPRHSPILLCTASPLQDRGSTEEDVPKLLVVPEISPEVAKALVEATGRAAEQLEELPEEEGGIEAEVEQVNSQMEEEVEELGTEEQEEDQECFEEPSGLGDPAVMRAVRSKPTLEVM